MREKTISAAAPTGLPYHSNAPPLWRRWFPYPHLSLLLALSWVLLQANVAPLTLLAAVFLGWAIPRLAAPVLGKAQRVRWWAALRLLVVVLWDIVVANVTLARATLDLRFRPRSRWLELPLRSQNERLNALLASIITMTPGTLSASFDPARRVLLVHQLDCPDEAAAVRQMDERYQQALLRVFGEGGQ